MRAPHPRLWAVWLSHRTAGAPPRESFYYRYGRYVGRLRPTSLLESKSIDALYLFNMVDSTADRPRPGPGPGRAEQGKAGPFFCFSVAAQVRRLHVNQCKRHVEGRLAVDREADKVTLSKERPTEATVHATSIHRDRLPDDDEVDQKCDPLCRMAESSKL